MRAETRIEVTGMTRTEKVVQIIMIYLPVEDAVMMGVHHALHVAVAGTVATLVIVTTRTVMLKSGIMTEEKRSGTAVEEIVVDHEEEVVSYFMSISSSFTYSK